MARLIARSVAIVLIVAIVLTLAASLGTPLAVVAQDASAGPSAAPPPTCSDRFPAEGPAGVDLRLGCVVSELVGLYTASSRDEPPRLSAYVLGLAATIAGGVLLTLLALRLLARRASARLAPVLPGEWWVCPSCRSVNAAGVTRCYACGSPPGDGPTMATAARPETPQSSGRPGA